MGRMPDWRMADEVTDAAKVLSWNVASPGVPPCRAWYVASGFDPAVVDDAFLKALRDVFWSAENKAFVLRNIDVKVETALDLPGVPILRVTFPERLVPSFSTERLTFVLYKALVLDGSIILDFARDWGGLSGAVQGSRTTTIMGDVATVLDATESPPPSGLLRKREQFARPLPRARRLSPPSGASASPTIVPLSGTMCDDVTDAGVRHGSDPWTVFGGRTQTPSAPKTVPLPASAPESVHEAAAPLPTKKDAPGDLPFLATLACLACVLAFILLLLVV